MWKGGRGRGTETGPGLTRGVGEWEGIQSPGEASLLGGRGADGIPAPPPPLPTPTPWKVVEERRQGMGEDGQTTAQEAGRRAEGSSRPGRGHRGPGVGVGGQTDGQERGVEETEGQTGQEGGGP